MKKLEGNDVCIETSLKEYGLAWVDQGDEYLFYYGDRVNENCEHITFNCAYIKKDIDFKKEFSWVNFEDVSSFISMDFFDLTFTQKITDLIDYYGSDEIFGGSYTEGIEFEDVIKDYTT